MENFSAGIALGVFFTVITWMVLSTVEYESGRWACMQVTNSDGCVQVWQPREE